MKSKSSGVSARLVSIMKRTTSLPTSFTTSASVTKSPARFDIFTGSPPPATRAARPVGHGVHGRLTTFDGAGVVSAPDVDEVIRRLRLFQMIGRVGAEIG